MQVNSGYAEELLAAEGGPIHEFGWCYCDWLGLMSFKSASPWCWIWQLLRHQKDDLRHSRPLQNVTPLLLT